ncbi:hypothetical protein [Corynebacterium sp. HMSC064E10]|nr:hypothetical protein [Corynebacterium sp. HMSC064E10]
MKKLLRKNRRSGTLFSAYAEVFPDKALGEFLVKTLLRIRGGIS